MEQLIIDFINILKEDEKYNKALTKRFDSKKKAGKKLIQTHHHFMKLVNISDQLDISLDELETGLKHACSISRQVLGAQPGVVWERHMISREAIFLALQDIDLETLKIAFSIWKVWKYEPTKSYFVWGCQITNWKLIYQNLDWKKYYIN